MAKNFFTKYQSFGPESVDLQLQAQMAQWLLPQQAGGEERHHMQLPEATCQEKHRLHTQQTLSVSSEHDRPQWA